MVNVTVHFQCVGTCGNYFSDARFLLHPTEFNFLCNKLLPFELTVFFNRICPGNYWMVNRYFFNPNDKRILVVHNMLPFNKNYVRNNRFLEIRHKNYMWNYNFKFIHSTLMWWVGVRVCAGVRDFVLQLLTTSVSIRNGEAKTRCWELGSALRLFSFPVWKV